MVSLENTVLLLSVMLSFLPDWRWGYQAPEVPSAVSRADDEE
jgi:hypothetical protein